MAGVASAAVIAAGVARAVMGIVVAAAGIGVKEQNAVGESLGSFVCIAGHTAIDSDTGLGKGHPGAAADAAANQCLDVMLSQQICQGAVAAGTGADNDGIHNLTALDGVDLEGCGVTEVLEDVAVFISNCDFHENSLLW